MSDHDAQTPDAPCGCAEEVDAQLASRNTRLRRAIIFGGSRHPGLMIETEQVEKGRGKAKAAAMFPSFCPVCGATYPSAEGRRAAA